MASRRAPATPTADRIAPRADGGARGRRLFFALWPEPALARALRDATSRLLRHGGRRLPPEGLHMTLVFLGQQDAAAQRRAESAAAGVHAEAFTLCLGRLGWWPRAGVLWCAPRDTPPELYRLQGMLARALAEAGFAQERRGFSPHLTLARKVARRPWSACPPELERCEWRVGAFQLVASRTLPSGAQYTPLKAFGLHSTRPARPGRVPDGSPDVE